ncbi:hypothetical protein CEN44_09340 [Fischerella muscicola CCMEE 5323]|uniref:Uncharacterized protein n=1 Tax=Fischerella muscicola CCMEE 5323 TaxID=2019572 RepID=A0A2N6K4J1_FISMU|nr:hypothetical protein CEN44_09340 [Fischerella muscicola CCMEE 5323]
MFCTQSVFIILKNIEVKNILSVNFIGFTSKYIDTLWQHLESKTTKLVNSTFKIYHNFWSCDLELANVCLRQKPLDQ